MRERGAVGPQPRCSRAAQRCHLDDLPDRFTAKAKPTGLLGALYDRPSSAALPEPMPVGNALAARKLLQRRQREQLMLLARRLVLASMTDNTPPLADPATTQNNGASDDGHVRLLKLHRPYLPLPLWDLIPAASIACRGTRFSSRPTRCMPLGTPSPAAPAPPRPCPRTVGTGSTTQKRPTPITTCQCPSPSRPAVRAARGHGPRPATTTDLP